MAIPLRLWQLYHDEDTVRRGWSNKSRRLFQPAKNRTKTPQQPAAVYPQVYLLERDRRPNPLKTRTSPPGSNGAEAPDMNEKASGRETWGFFVSDVPIKSGTQAWIPPRITPRGC